MPVHFSDAILQVANCRIVGGASVLASRLVGSLAPPAAGQRPALQISCDAKTGVGQGFTDLAAAPSPFWVLAQRRGREMSARDEDFQFVLIRKGWVRLRVAVFADGHQGCKHCSDAAVS